MTVNPLFVMGWVAVISRCATRRRILTDGYLQALKLHGDMPRSMIALSVCVDSVSSSMLLRRGPSAPRLARPQISTSPQLSALQTRRPKRKKAASGRALAARSLRASLRREALTARRLRRRHEAARRRALAARSLRATTRRGALAARRLRRRQEAARRRTLAARSLRTSSRRKALTARRLRRRQEAARRRTLAARSLRASSRRKALTARRLRRRRGALAAGRLISSPRRRQRSRGLKACQRRSRLSRWRESKRTRLTQKRAGH